MEDFWGPFFVGLGWLALALIVLWLIKRPSMHRLALHSASARVLAWILAAYAFTTFAVGLPYSLSFCRGGFDDPIRCWAFSADIAGVLAPLWLLLVLAGIVVVPVLSAAILVLELLKRR